ncbi:hypothetical protein SEUCBS139899_009823 [Sporothrix eucalyptigena]|uniref:Isoamyl alcohol n=1 Tax=Sporothrix eucalyptigena TaxID=1812306 RepID=A0ABP0D0G8_9PEZI
MSRLLRFVTTFAAFWAASSNALILGPVKGPSRAGSSMVPSSGIKLHYGVGSQSLVNVSLSMHHPAVLLEDIPSVTSVACSSSAISIVFNSSSAFTSAATHWILDPSLVLVTNHLGNCDAELERGFFVADAIETLNASLTLIARATKANVNQTSDAVEIEFSSIPSSSTANSRRDISWDPTLTISNSLSLPSSTVLYSYAPYATVTADHATISLSSTISGNLKYSVSSATLTQLTVDFDTSLSADLGVTVDVGAPYDTTFTYTAPALSYDLVNIPGILTIGPELLFGVGVDLSASGAVTVVADVGVAVADGNVHVDFQNSSSSSTSGWTPTYTSMVNITEKATVSVDPFLDLTVELAFQVLGGLLDLSVGLEAQPRFNNNFTLSATQDISPTTVAQPTTTGACSQGIEVDSEFVFDLIANVTQFWSDTIYSVTVPIATHCYSWL